MAGSTARIERTHIRDLNGQLSDGSGGEAVHGRADPDRTGRATIMLATNHIERAQRSGVSVSGSAFSMVATAIHDIRPGINGTLGTGVQLLSDASFGPVEGTISGSTIERAHAGGIAVEASSVTVTTTTVRNTLAQQSDNSFGRGIQVQSDGVSVASQFAMSASLVEDSLDVGVLTVDSSLALDGVLVRRTSPRPNGSFGDGVAAVSLLGVASATLNGSRVEDSARAGLGSFGGDVALSTSTFLCNPVTLNGEIYNRDFSFADGGGNVCGCGAAREECVVLSTSLEPPTAP